MNSIKIMSIEMKTLFLIIQIKIALTLNNEINLECFGKKYVDVSLTAYYPDYDDEDNTKVFQDIRSESLYTLQDYLDTRNNFTTLSMDSQLGILYGTPVCIPELNKHFGYRLRIEIRDTSDDLRGMGYSRADICVRSEVDSYDVVVNRKVTLIFVNE